jgi:TATA-binding protein-associated factor Taf7
MRYNKNRETQIAFRNEERRIKMKAYEEMLAIVEKIVDALIERDGRNEDVVDMLNAACELREAIRTKLGLSNE